MTEYESDLPLKPLVVSCLMGFDQLQQTAGELGLQLSESARKFLVLQLLKKLGPRHVQKLVSKFVSEGLISWEDDFYEVDYIIDHCQDENTGEMYYLIKWDGWGEDHNSWEPRSNLQCDKVIDAYTAQINSNRGVKRKCKEMAKYCGPTSKNILVDELLDRLSSSNKMTPMDIFRVYSPAKKVRKIEPLIGMPLTQRLKLRPTLKKKNQISKKVQREDVQQALKDWETQMNQIVKGVDTAPIRVVNDVDLEGPPDTFVYINHCKEGPGVTIPKDPLVGCECEDCYSSKKTCCAACSGTEFAYYKHSRIRLPPGRPVYECNVRCKCGPDCANRVVQKGRKVKICIFRTDNNRGWGVKTLQPIKKGSFVMEYVGEVITHEEAERRGMEYDAVGRTYLFDLDFADTNTAFTVDAGMYGNAAHFINHSCDPNMEVYCVWVNCLDPRMPHICMFAKRDIAKDEELSFDYLCARPKDDEDKPAETASSSIASDTGSSTTATTKDSKDLSCDISTPPPTPSDNGDVVAVGQTGDSPPKDQTSTESSSSSSSSKNAPNSYSCICQCGAANCRIYLF